MLHVALAAVYALSLAGPVVSQKKLEPQVDRAAVVDGSVPANPMIGHMVFFKLKDATAANKKKLVDACNKYLSNMDGVAFFSAGVLADELNQPVNDRDWDVALHVVFTDKAAHDKYQTHANHLKFIAENKDLWTKVRAFDSELAGYKLGKK